MFQDLPDYFTVPDEICNSVNRIVIGILDFLHGVCNSMLQNRINYVWRRQVNAGRLYVLYVFTQSYCVQYPDRVSDIWRIYDQITNQSNGRIFNQWNGRIHCPSTNQKPGKRINQKTGYTKKQPIDSTDIKLTKKTGLNVYIESNLSNGRIFNQWDGRIQSPSTNQKRVTSFTSASQLHICTFVYIQWQNRHWHSGCKSWIVHLCILSTSLHEIKNKNHLFYFFRFFRPIYADLCCIVHYIVLLYNFLGLLFKPFVCLLSVYTEWVLVKMDIDREFDTDEFFQALSSGNNTSTIDTEDTDHDPWNEVRRKRNKKKKGK